MKAVSRRPHSTAPFGSSVSRVVALVVLVLGAACTEVGDPVIGSVTATTVVRVVDGSDAGALEAEVAVGPTATTIFSPRADPDYVPTLLVTAGGTVFQVDDATIAPLVDADSLRVLDAADDLNGGLVAETSSDVSGSTIEWFASGGTSFARVDATGGGLLDVTYADGSPEALVLLDDGVERVERISLVSTVRTPLAPVGDGETLLDVSASSGRYLLVTADQACGGLRFLDASGDELNLVGPPAPECPVPRRPAIGLAALSPDGDAVAYTELTYRSDGLVTSTDVVIWELGQDTELARVTVGGDGETVRDLAFDGQRVAILRTDVTEADGDVAAVERDVVELYDPAGGAELVSSVPLADATAIRFARLPVAVSFTDTPIAEAGTDDG